MDNRIGTTTAKLLRVGPELRSRVGLVKARRRVNRREEIPLPDRRKAKQARVLRLRAVCQPIFLPISECPPRNRGISIPTGHRYRYLISSALGTAGRPTIRCYLGSFEEIFSVHGVACFLANSFTIRRAKIEPALVHGRLGPGTRPSFEN